MTLAQQLAVAMGLDTRIVNGRTYIRELNDGSEKVFDPEHSADDRELVIAHLRSKGISCQITYGTRSTVICIYKDPWDGASDSGSHDTLGTRFCELALEAMKKSKATQ